MIKPGFSFFRITAYVTVASLMLGLFMWQTTAIPRPLPGSIVHPQAKAPYQPVRYTIKMQQTPCFGPCPIFDITVRGDGVATLRIAQREGAMKEAITQEQHLRLVELIEKGNFRSLNSDYSVDVTDLPSTILTVDSPLGWREVSVYGVPCKTAAKSIPREQLEDFGIKEFVPDVFCSLEEQLNDIACQIYARQSEIDDSNRREGMMWNPAPSCEKKH